MSKWVVLYYDLENQLKLDDETYKIILNAACPIEKVPERLKPLYRYIQNREDISGDENELIKKIDERVKKYNSSTWRRRLMTLAELMEIKFDTGFDNGKAEGLEQGRSEGLELGRLQGQSEGVEKTAREMKLNGISFDLIGKCTGLSEDKIENL